MTDFAIPLAPRCPCSLSLSFSLVYPFPYLCFRWSFLCFYSDLIKLDGTRRANRYICTSERKTKETRDGGKWRCCRNRCTMLDEESTTQSPSFFLSISRCPLVEERVVPLFNSNSRWARLLPYRKTSACYETIDQRCSSGRSCREEVKSGFLFFFSFFLSAVGRWSGWPT